jgi:hypothetical protein
MSRVDDWINPIAIKEMRQAVKGRVVAWVFMIFLLIQLVIIGGALILREDIGQDFNVGRNILMGLLSVLLGSCLLFLPGFTGFRLSSEKSDYNVDLFFVTSLRPFGIIWGKLLAALILTVLFFSASMPFMTLTYLLRGLDLPSMFILLALDFLVVAGCIQFGILVACLPGGLVSRGIRALVAFFILLGVFQMTLSASFGMLYMGIGSSITSWNFWGPALNIIAFILMGIGLMFILSVTIITPNSANKALGIRIYLLFLWIATGAIASVWFLATASSSIVMIWTIGMVLIFSVGLFCAICERRSHGPRIIRAIPHKMVYRIPAFFLYSGAAGGIAYSIIMIAATVLVAFIVDNFIGIPSAAHFVASRLNSIPTAVGLGSYAVCYALTALLITRLFFSRSSRPGICAVIAMFLMTFGTVLPMLIGFMLRRNHYVELPPEWYLGNPFVLFWENDMWPMCLAFTGLWGASVVILNLPWFVEQVRCFKPTLQTKTDVSE